MEDHLEKLKVVLTRLQDAGLKINADKSKFCAHETEYLGYVLTRDGIKPQMNKVQLILALKSPINVNELQQFLGMVQYYCDLWAKHSEMLALSPIWLESVVRPKSPERKEPKSSPGTGMRSTKRYSRQ